MKIINEDNFDSVIKNNEKCVLVDFWAEWCGPCRMLLPIVDELSGELNIVDIYKCNVDESPKLAEKFNIQSIPTLILFDKEGNILNKRVGGASKVVLKEWIESNIK